MVEEDAKNPIEDQLDLPSSDEEKEKEVKFRFKSFPEADMAAPHFKSDMIFSTFKQDLWIDNTAYKGSVLFFFF